MKRTLITAPTETPVTLAEAKLWEVVEHSADDALITDLIEQATDYCQQYTGRFFVQQTWEYRYDCAPSTPELVVDGGYNVLEVSTLSITESDLSSTNYLTETAISTVFYIDRLAEPFRMHPKSGAWDVASSGYDNLAMRLKQGYGAATAVPDSIKSAILLMVGHLYRNREATAAIKLENIPFGVSSMLNQYRVIEL
ncbi:head-tail connector protein [uncultured Paraglaciecola sp.]|uniref:head-tail connector protein n=1 Tax=uncultured Paraglaciecola sp. TaxID=1765024 RepID=UPI002615F4A9|nr:head-tail connector protein [uncultured Paraglaciecola sp.]